MLVWLLTLGLVFAKAESSNQDPQTQWEEWKKETFKTALESPTSFLNAYALESSFSGKSLYLVIDKDKRKNRWLKEVPKNFYAQAEHLGEKIRIQINGNTLGYVNKDKRRRTFELPNGAIAEVVYGRRSAKLWGYLYDPEQIKDFTGFRFYPFNIKAITHGIFKSQKPHVVSYKTVQGDPTEVTQVGNISFVLHGKEFFLPAYSWQKMGTPLKYVEVVFTDQAKGVETYGGGRSLTIDIEKGLKDGQKLQLDFNRTINFYCAHSPFWHCPTGLQKYLDVKVAAGERLPLKKIVK